MANYVLYSMILRSTRNYYDDAHLYLPVTIQSKNKESFLIMTRRKPEQLVSPTLVRIVAAILFFIGLFLIYIAATNYDAMGIWVALGVGIGGATSCMFSAQSFITGDPEYILLDLIIPG